MQHNQKENLMQEVTGHKPVLDITTDLDFHKITLYLFWRLFLNYGKEDSLKKVSYSINTPSVMFVLDPSKTGGVTGSFLCVSEGGNLSYNLSYYVSENLDWSERSPVQNFPKFQFSAGYRSSSGVPRGYIWEPDRLIPGYYETSLNITGPKFQSTIHFNEFETEFFLAKIIKEDVLGLKLWIEVKTHEARHPQRVHA